MGEEVQKGEIVDIGSIHAVFLHVAENIIGWKKDWVSIPPLSPKSIPEYFDTPFQRSKSARL